MNSRLSARLALVQVVRLGKRIQPSAVHAASDIIDFETPPLAASARQAVGAGTVVKSIRKSCKAAGLVKNNSTSACVEPANSNQNLCTGVTTSIGLSGFPVGAAFRDIVPMDVIGRSVRPVNYSP